jgi:hypothetical protein
MIEKAAYYNYIDGFVFYYDQNGNEIFNEKSKEELNYDYKLDVNYIKKIRPIKIEIYYCPKMPSHKGIVFQDKNDITIDWGNFVGYDPNINSIMEYISNKKGKIDVEWMKENKDNIEFVDSYSKDVDRVHCIIL